MFLRYDCDIQRLVINLLVLNYHVFQITVIYINRFLNNYKSIFYILKLKNNIFIKKKYNFLVEYYFYKISI